MDLFDIAIAKKLAGGGGGGGGGLEYEKGTIKPPSYNPLLTIPFENAHSKPPTMFAISIKSTSAGNKNLSFIYLDSVALSGSSFPISSSSQGYGFWAGVGMRSSSATIYTGRFLYPQGTEGNTQDYPSYFCSNTSITARISASNVSWNNNEEYEWIAIWT